MVSTLAALILPSLAPLKTMESVQLVFQECSNLLIVLVVAKHVQRVSLPINARLLSATRARKVFTTMSKATQNVPHAWLGVTVIKALRVSLLLAKVVPLANMHLAPIQFPASIVRQVPTTKIHKVRLQNMTSNPIVKIVQLENIPNFWGMVWNVLNVFRQKLVELWNVVDAVLVHI
jgi:hypothetical protein|tara:strand:- start:79 stop:606 length:528 start_codon:yes stop_codon:yes gene_type:complete